MLESKPDYVPVHRNPVWLSSVDVLAAIDRIAEEELALSNASPATTLWYTRFEILKLIEKENDDG